MKVLMFISLYLAFIILILAFSHFSDKIRKVYANPSIFSMIGYSVALISMAGFLVYPFYSLLGGIASILFGLVGILQIRVYPEITTGYVQSALAVITGFTIILMYYLGAVELLDFYDL